CCATSQVSTRSSPSALKYFSPARFENCDCIQPTGVRVEMPMSLSSQTKRTGQGRFWCAVQPAELNAACAVAWFADASPNEQYTIESAGTGVSMPSSFACASATAAPTAFGKCDAIVEVCGGTQAFTEPHTLWRPPEIGSSADALKDSAVS